VSEPILRGRFLPYLIYLFSPDTPPRARVRVGRKAASAASRRRPKGGAHLAHDSRTRAIRRCRRMLVQRGVGVTAGRGPTALQSAAGWRRCMAGRVAVGRRV